MDLAKYKESFIKNTEFKETGNRYNWECKLGLWSVSAPTLKQALSEALHYYAQYYNDGEYEKGHICGS